MLQLQGVDGRGKCSLDISWLGSDGQQNANDLPSTEELAGAVIEHLEAALEAFRRVADSLGRSDRYRDRGPKGVRSFFWGNPCRKGERDGVGAGTRACPNDIGQPRGLPLRTDGDRSGLMIESAKI